MTFTARQRLLHLWTALLCLVASFAYLTREPDDLSGALSLPGLAGMALSSDMAGMDKRPDGEMAMGDGSRTISSESAAHDHSSQSPNSHNHAAHCPFCFSAAFALEAQGFVLALAEAPHLTFLHLPYLQPHLLAPRHAEARAPPMKPDLFPFHSWRLVQSA
ncbi:hypothetical protein GCM10022631_17620 [Deinococcus rubellus]|uniref:DUF2946 family protein n=1 Tax=Deinococcus rubellus TaxID=1889240 RepID=UPI0031EEF578